MQRLQALSLAQLATAVMTNAFSSGWTPGADMTGLGTITDYFLPDYGAPRAGDGTSAEEYALRDLIAEGVQVLEHARLIRSAFGYGGCCDTRSHVMSELVEEVWPMPET